MRFFDEKDLADIHNMNLNAELEEARIKKIIDERIQIMFQQLLFSYGIFKDAIKEYPSACCKVGIQPCTKKHNIGLFKEKISAYKLPYSYILVSERGKLYQCKRRDSEFCFPIDDKLLRSLFLKQCDEYIRLGSRNDDNLWKDKRTTQEPHIVGWVEGVAGSRVRRELNPLFDFECYEKSKIESNIQKLFTRFLQDIISKH